MLLTVTLCLFWSIVLIVVIHYGALFLFLHRLTRPEWKKPEGDFTPKTMVLFPLRGADPSLPRSLEKILTQNYPNYRIRFIFDSAEDSALPLVEAALKKWGSQHAEIKIMPEHFSTCALKCCAHYHGIADLDPSFEAVAVLDADTNPPNDWLKRLVEPLSDPQFFVATGLRWYIPHRANTGSLVRYLWNAAAVVQHDLYKIPWGGSLALRRELFTKSDLLERWKHSFTDDTPIPSAVRQVNGKIALVPSLFLVNRETCGLRAFHRWVKRQMLLAKLYHPAWKAILGQAVLITLPLLLLAGTFLAGLIVQDGRVALWSLIAFIFYWAGVFGTVPIIEKAIRRIVRQNGEPVEKWSPYRTILTFAMVPVTQGVYTSALFWLYFLHKVEWRGIEYEITGKQVRLVAYKPYTAKPGGQEEQHSL
jgi:cellulose synthase/poly-beta-1,6-N-acetylglucosamine synthase-like glycosyltransferase